MEPHGTLLNLVEPFGTSIHLSEAQRTSATVSAPGWPFANQRERRRTLVRRSVNLAQPWRISDNLGEHGET